MSKKVVAIIQARMGSTRLPGKVLLPLQGKPVIVRDLERIARASLLSSMIVATTSDPADDVLIEAVQTYSPGTTIFRGSKADVLDRYYRAAKETAADIIVRITSDCPLIDPDVIDRVLQEFEKEPSLDYASNVLLKRTFPRGLDVEALSFAALERLWKSVADPEDREHVTLYIKKHPQEFKTSHVVCERDLSFHRWTLDEQSDYALISRVYDALYPGKPDFRTDDILGLFAKEPELITINQDVVQKLGEF